MHKIIHTKVHATFIIIIIIIMLYSADIKGEARDKEMKIDGVNLH